VNQLTLLVCCTFLLLTLFSANSGAVEAEHPVIKLEPQHTDHTDATLVIKAPIPQKGAMFLLEVELTTEDEDDRRNSVSDFFKPFFAYDSNIEGGYNNYLKHRLLHLDSQVNNRPAIPFFILYHSWKSDLT
jgi:hypothetical protein